MNHPSKSISNINTNININTNSRPCKTRNCDSNLTSNTPATQYQRQKIIQNTVRVPSSLYTMNLGSLNAYQNPPRGIIGWNQMSDRVYPSVQKNPTSSGSGYGGNSTKRTITRLRPGALSPGGAGVDIKHNSYDRYLNKLKGKGPLRRGIIPPDFGVPFIPFNRAFPVYGGKTTKTSIVNGCNCPITYKQDNTGSIYVNPYSEFYNVEYKYFVGTEVYAIKTGTIHNRKAVVVQRLAYDMYLVEFEDNTTELKLYSELLVYFPCDCTPTKLSNIDLAVTNFCIIDTNPDNGQTKPPIPVI